MTVAGLTVTLAPTQVEALLWACAAATGPSRFPVELTRMLGGAEARLILALAHAASVEDDQHDTSDQPTCDRCGRRWPLCTCRRPNRPGPESADGPEPEGSQP